MLLGMAAVTGEHIMTIAGTGVYGEQNSTFNMYGSGSLESNVSPTSAHLANPGGVAYSSASTIISYIH
jgi:hypothetical protein